MFDYQSYFLHEHLAVCVSVYLSWVLKSMTFVKNRNWEPTILDYVRKKRIRGEINEVSFSNAGVLWSSSFCLSLDMLNASKISMNEKLIAEISRSVSYVRGNDLMHKQGSDTYFSSFRWRNYQGNVESHVKLPSTCTQHLHSARFE